ncbi:hypothetical protein, partial [Loigolactobacillus coryniformis]
IKTPIARRFYFSFELMFLAHRTKQREMRHKSPNYYFADKIEQFAKSTNSFDAAGADILVAKIIPQET